MGRANELLGSSSKPSLGQLVSSVFAAGAIGTLSGMRSEVEARLREQLERVLAGMDLVSREEFEAAKAMATKARSEQEDLQKRVTELESQVRALTGHEPAKGAAADDTSPADS